MSTATQLAQISLELGCTPECDEFATTLYNQLRRGNYDEMAAMGLPESREAWEIAHRTARKRAWRAEHFGYFAASIIRQEFEDDIYRINTSRPMRQGRLMSEAYQRLPVFGDDDYPCAEHGVHPYGVLDGHGTLVAYLFMYRAGDLALVSQVLGHAAHQEAGIMYLLFREALAHEARIAPGVCVYGRYDSGQDGLRFLKDRVGFVPTQVEWLP